MPSKVDEILARVGATPRTPAGDRRLAAMLRQDGSHFAGLSTGEAERVRGHLFAAFAGRRVPGPALIAIKEELRTSFSPAVLAGAARALAALDEADPDMEALLAAALERIRVHDEYVRFRGSDEAPKTARGEIEAALAHLSGGPRGCCGTIAAAPGESVAVAPFPLCPSAMGRVTVEDQFEAEHRFDALLRGQTSLLAFFYTRCMNPAKCSLTVTRLAGFARRAEEISPEARPNVLVLSYDSGYDDPGRLLAYGRDRGFPFGGRARLMRCRTGWNTLRRAFGLRVGYGLATVNAHARELFLVSADLSAIPLDPEAAADSEALMARIAAQQSGASIT